MRYLVGIFFAATTLVLCLFLSGPYLVRPPHAMTAEVAEIERLRVSDVDKFVQDGELKFASDLRTGLAKRIVWAGRHGTRTSVSIVYLHGWSASSGDTAPYVEDVAKKLGANLYLTRFTAHGLRDGRAFAGLTQQALTDDARAALAIGKLLGDRVVVIGTSTGATLATQLAIEETHHPELAALVLLSPNFRPKNLFAPYATGPLGRFWVRAFVGVEYSFKTENFSHGYNWTSRYPAVGLVALMDTVNYVDTLDFRQIMIPVLVLFTNKDKVVSLPAIRRRFAEFASASKSLVDLSSATRHELVGDALAPQATQPAVESTVRFLTPIVIH